ncbi:MAG: cytochrome P450 [Crocinitomicaceae bacterium]|nr:cytochrome P450 [Crocinitomicaceae bacterium]
MSITESQLPGPKGLPILGNLLKIDVNNMHNQMERWAEEYGKVYRLSLPIANLVVITDPVITQIILKNRPYKFVRMTKLDRILRREGIHGVFNAEGDEWELHRRMVTKGLDVKHQKDFFPQMLRTVERLHNKWSKNADNGEIIDLQSDFLRFTVDITSSLAFGYEMNTIEQDGGVVQDHMEKIFPMIFKRINAPIPWYKVFRTKEDREYDKALSEVNKLVDDFIIQGRKRLKDNPKLRENPKNFLEAILVAAEEEEDFGDKEVKGNLLTLLLAGEDTTAHTLSWAIFLLTKFPESQERLINESIEILGDSKWLENYDDHNKFEYLDGISNETMRLKPVAPILLFEPTEKVEIEGYVFEKGQLLLLETRYASIQDEHFTDGETFNPARWIKETKCPVHNMNSFVPFGGGPRYCPGRNLAILEIEMVLSMLFKNFKVEMVTPHEDVKEIMAFTMMASDYKIKLTHRN